MRLSGCMCMSVCACCRSARLYIKYPSSYTYMLVGDVIYIYTMLNWREYARQWMHISDLGQFFFRSHLFFSLILSFARFCFFSVCLFVGISRTSWVQQKTIESHSPSCTVHTHKPHSDGRRRARASEWEGETRDRVQRVSTVHCCRLLNGSEYALIWMRQYVFIWNYAAVCTHTHTHTQRWLWTFQCAYVYAV